MASYLLLIVLVILFCKSSAVVGARRNHHSVAAALDDNDGICKSVVNPLGYVCQEHNVTTQDGYILSMQNIPHGRSNGSTGNRPPVLLQHGLLMDAITWLLNPPDQSLALLLTDNGFDVWLASTRGTKYSRDHTNLTTDNATYWDWTWDELVAYDLPATFQYVNNQTGQKLHYVGHSLGTLIALASFSKGQLVNMTRSAALLSPIAYAGQMTSPLARSYAVDFLANPLKWLDLHEFKPIEDDILQLLKYTCEQPGFDCRPMLTPFTGPNCCINSSIFNSLLDHEPQSSSTKNMIHMAQMIINGTLQMYDYLNEGENMKHYGQLTPPAYNMSNIPNDLPLFFSYGGADTLADVNDVQHLHDSLKEHDADKFVFQYIEDYAHFDYFMAVNATQVVYNPLIAFFRLH